LARHDIDRRVAQAVGIEATPDMQMVIQGNHIDANDP
jgi:hypothetical protein